MFGECNAYEILELISRKKAEDWCIDTPKAR